MTVKTNLIKEFALMGLDRLDNVTKDLKPEQLDWKSCPQANTVRWVLTHVSEVLNVYMPKFLGAAPPNKWPKDYVGNTSYKLEKIKKDIERGTRGLKAGLNKLTNEKLEEEISGWAGKKSRQSYIMLMVGEVFHHEGQIAAMLGVEKRIKGQK